MNDELVFEYLTQMGAMAPEEEQLRRKQAQVDYLRRASLEAPQAQQAGRVVVAPSWTQVLGQVGQAYAANRGQKAMDKAYGDFTTRRIGALRAKRNQAFQPVMQEDEDVVEGFGASGYYR